MEFSAYVHVGPQRYRERPGLAFEELQAGQRFQHRPGLTLSQQDNTDEALDTLNHAQLHYDARYAARTEWGRPLLVSTLTLQCLVGMTGKTFGRRARIIGFDEIALTGPVFGGDTLYAESEVLAVEDDPEHPDLGLVVAALRGVSQAADVVARMTARMLLYRDGADPEERELGHPLPRARAQRFASHRARPDGALVEQVGLFFEDLEPGETFEHRPGKTFFPQEAVTHALRTLEWQPRHVDQHYADTYLDGRIAVTEAYVVGAVTALTTRTFGRVVANLGWIGVHLGAPVYLGDTVYAESTVEGARPSASRPDQGILEVRTHAHNQRGELVASFGRRLLVYRRGAGPHANAGY
ncbi:MAG: MaoC family dehydratase [Candidatus Rokubacteria bacterium]|nr:MaoC family dehydratase [Candidatus Rokubacteria bacterium]